MSDIAIECRRGVSLGCGRRLRVGGESETKFKLNAAACGVAGIDAAMNYSVPLLNKSIIFDAHIISDNGKRILIDEITDG